MKKRPSSPKSGQAPGPKLLWIVDPWETLDHPKDTTLRLAEEALRLGARCFIAENRSISLIGGKAHARVSEITGIDRPRTPDRVVRAPPMKMPIAGFDHLFYRTDPPVDLSYLLPLQILSFGERTREKRYPKIHSPIESLYFLSEKWAMAYLKGYLPECVVSADLDELAEFAMVHPKSVLKPLYLAQSKGVQVLTRSELAPDGNDRRLRKVLDESTEGGKLPVILQEFLAGIAKGETRLWFAGGKLIASVKKWPITGEAIIDMDRGGTLAKTKLGGREKKAARAIEKLLRREKILFAAVDLIDGKITDFNHTSPGLLVPMEELLHENLAQKALAPLFKRRTT